MDKIQDKYIKDEWLVQSAYIADQMRIQYGVTSYQLNQAMAIHKILDSREFEKIVQEFPQNEETMLRI